MAKMHSRARGRSGSKKPLVDTPKSWVSYSSDEVEQLVVKLSKSGKTSAQIGLALRDSYGIPDVKTITKKGVSKILSDNKLSPKVPEDLFSLLKKSEYLNKHIKKNTKDIASRRGLILTESKIRRLTKYYKRTGLLPATWIHSRDADTTSANSS